MLFLIFITKEESEDVVSSAAIGVLMMVFLIAGISLLGEYYSLTITPIDVYRGKTTLEITYRDSIAIDSTVVRKEELKMTREEQIRQEIDYQLAGSFGNYPEGYEEGFIEGAKWADEHPNISEEEQIGMGGLGMTWQKKALIDKACDWMKEALIDYWSGINADSSNFINDFKRAMEEQV